MYEFNRHRGGLGWTGGFRLSADGDHFSNQGCSGQTSAGGTRIEGGRTVCARPNEFSFMGREGCVQVGFRGSQNCITDGGYAGRFYCCAPGRPRRGQASLPPTESRIAPEYTPGEEMEIPEEKSTWQEWIEAAIPGAPEDKVEDGVYVPQPSPQVTNGAPGAQQPQRPPVPRPPARREGEGEGEGEGGRREEASIFGALPWWGWLGLAGGVGLVALLGVYLYQAGEEDEEELTSRELALLGERY